MQGNRAGMFYDEIWNYKDSMPEMKTDKHLKQSVLDWIEEGKYEKLLELWVKGYDLDWNRLYGNLKPCMIPLPVYPFSGQRYWIPQKENKKYDSIHQNHSVLHPLIHVNTSTLDSQRFTSTFTGSEFFLSDHIVNGKRIMPGAAMLEMARASIAFSLNSFEDLEVLITLYDVTWLQPMVVETKADFQVEVFYEEDGDIAFEISKISAADDDNLIIYCQGRAGVSEKTALEHPLMNIADIKKRCNLGYLSSEQIYNYFDRLGIHYGPSHQGIESIYIGRDELLAKIAMPENSMFDQPGLVLHPSLLDSAFQSGIGFFFDKVKKGQSFAPALPFALERCEIHTALKSPLWVHVWKNENPKAENTFSKYQMDICDEAGRICVNLMGMSTRPYKSASPIKPDD